MSARPITISLHAMGGQGGGVLADWLVAVAHQCGWIAQSTSVPGVAQRTGATVYYLELFPRPAPGGPEPVLALMPMPGDVDLVIASELMEAGRAISRGFVTPERTTLVASTHRVYGIGEKSGMGDGRVDAEPVLEAARSASRRLVLADMEALAEASGTVISATLFGAVAASGALPFPRDAYEEAIRASGIAVAGNLRGFAAGWDAAHAEWQAEAPRRSLDDEAMVAEGVRRLVDYQDRAYADLYRARLQRFAPFERPGGLLTRELARYLALWMSYEDTVRVAGLKVRSARFDRVRGEVGAEPGQIVHTVEFLHPRVEEICETLPRALGAWALRNAWTRGLIGRLARGRHIATSKLGGFLLLYALAALRPMRRSTLRFAHENAKIEAWLDRVEATARRDYDLAVEVVRCQRLIKGYGETYQRGWSNFSALMQRVDRLDAAGLARLRTAALADEDGKALAQAMAA